jgi:predicted site-specific integrase-resolvase
MKNVNLVILHKDRLTRFGFNYIKKCIESNNGNIIVINPEKTDQDDLLKDFIAIITSFCCRLYGARRGQSKALKIKQEINQND